MWNWKCAGKCWSKIKNTAVQRLSWKKVKVVSWVWGLEEAEFTGSDYNQRILQANLREATPPGKGHSEVAQSCPTLCDHMDCSLRGSSIHGIFQARVMEWAAISFSRESSQPSDQTWVSHIADRHFTIWATKDIVGSRQICKDREKEIKSNLIQLPPLTSSRISHWPNQGARESLDTA